jgi:hypothetical protein
MLNMFEKLCTFYNDMVFISNHANIAAYQLYNLTDDELKELGLTRIEIPYVSQTSALKIK